MSMWHERWKGDAGGPETFQGALSQCDQEAFPTIRRLLAIAVCQPVTTATAERSFSTLRRTKTWLRNRIGQKRLSALALMNVHPELMPPVEEVVLEFMGKRRRSLSK